MEWVKSLGSLAWLMPMLGLTQLSFADGDDGGDGGDGSGGGTQLTGGSQGGQGGQSGEGGDWKDQIPEDIRTNAAFANVKDIPDLCTQFVNAQKLIGVDKVALPNQNWKDEEWAAFYNKVGRPESHEAYKKPELSFPEGFGFTDEEYADITKAFHASGLTQKQLDSVLKYYAGVITSRHTKSTQAAESAHAQAVNSLRDEWGDDYGNKVDVAQAMIRKFGDDQLATVLDETGMGDNPALIKMLAKAGVSIMEDHATGTGDGLIIGDAASAKTEIDSLKGDADFQKALMERENPGHAAAVARWQGLHEKAYGKELVK